MKTENDIKYCTTNGVPNEKLIALRICPICINDIPSDVIDYCPFCGSPIVEVNNDA